VITVQPYPAVMTNLGREYEAWCVMFSAIDAALDDGVQRRRHHPPGRSHRRCALAVTALAGDVDTQYVYTTTTDGSDLTDVYGPLHAVQLATGPPAPTGSTPTTSTDREPKRTSSPRRYRLVVAP